MGVPVGLVVVEFVVGAVVVVFIGIITIVELDGICVGE